MEEQELLWSSSQQELVRGIALRDGQYHYLLCGVAFPQGEVFPRGGRFYNAEAMAVLHLREAHDSMLEYLLHRSPGLLGLFEVQLELLRILVEDYTDKEVTAQKRVSPSTVRNHRSRLREKERQARLFLALVELLRTSRISSPVDTGFRHPRPATSMVNARYTVTKEGRQAILAACFDEASALHRQPVREKHKLVVLSAIAEQFTPGRQYTEKKVNRLLGRIYGDFPYLRRLLIEYSFLGRAISGSTYWRKKQAVGRAVGGQAVALLLAGRTVSRFSSSFYLVVLPLYVLERIGNLGASNLLLTLTNPPPLLAVSFLGPLVERVHRKGSLILYGFGTSTLYTFPLLFPGPPPPFLLTGAMLFRLLSHLFETASKVLFSEPHPPEHLSSLSGIRSLLDHSVAVLAPAAGALLFRLYGFRTILLLYALAYGLSTLQECFIPCMPHPIQRAEPPRLRAGIRYLLGRRELLSLFLLVMALNFFVANSEEVIFPGILAKLYQFPESQYGLAVSVSIAGTLLASLFLIRAAHLRLLEYPRALLLTNSALMAAPGLVTPLLRSIPKLYFVLFFTSQLLTGQLTVCIDVPLISYFQTRAPLEQQGRFFVLLAFFSGILIPLGVSYTEVLADWLGPDTAYACSNLCVIVLVLLVRLPA